MKKQQPSYTKSEVLPSVGVEVPDDTPKQGNCGVTACAILAQRTFKETWDAFYIFTPKGEQWKGSSKLREQRKVLTHFGVRIEEIPVPYARMTVGTYAKGAWRDNVSVERLWRTIKYEEVYLRAYASVSEARASIGRYLGFCNSRRPHSSLHGKTLDQAYFNQPMPGVAAA